MDLNRTLVRASLATAALATAAVATALRAHSRRSIYKTSTGGCDPDLGHYVDARLIVHDVDGSHQGLAVAILRDRLLDDDPAAPVLEMDFDEAFQSCIEVALTLVLNIAEGEIEPCSCGDEDCDNGSDYETLHLVAGRKMVEFAMTCEAEASEHAEECRTCATEGTQAPAFLRAQFCRDLADDLLTNFDSDAVTLRGVPIAATVDVLARLVDYIAQFHGVTPETQIERLSLGVAQAMAHKEGHEAPKP